MNKTTRILLLSTMLLFIGGGCALSNRLKTTNYTVQNNTTNESSNANGNTNQPSSGPTTPSATDTKNWLTYSNNKYNFTIKYPQEWGAEEIQRGGLGTDQGDIIISNGQCNIQITVPHSQYNLERNINEFKNSFSSGTYFGDKIEQVNVNAIEAIKYQDTVNANNEVGNVYVFMIEEQIFIYTLKSGLTENDCVKISDNIFETLNTINS